MDFKGFYDHLVFDVDKPILQTFTGKHGDTKSRGLNVTITQKNQIIKDLTGLSLKFFYEKPDKTRGFIDAVKADNKFRVDYTNQVYAVPGIVKAELRLLGPDKEVISTKTFKIAVDASIADGSIISEDERGILDRAFELAEDLIPRIELLDIELLEDVSARMTSLEDQTEYNANAISDIQDDFMTHKNDYATEMGDIEALTTASKQVVGALNEINAGKANAVQEAWITPTLVNGWEGNIKYRKNGFGYVEIFGTLSVVGSGPHVFTLPTGYRPSGNTYFLVIDRSTAKVNGDNYINASGYVRVASNNATITINTQFPLD